MYAANNINEPSLFSLSLSISAFDVRSNSYVNQAHIFNSFNILIFSKLIDSTDISIASAHKVWMETVKNGRQEKKIVRRGRHNDIYLCLSSRHCVIH